MATNDQIENFIKLFGTLAVAECNRRIAQGKGFILPSVCMAQSALESDWGQAGLMKKANAFFGIKAGGSWTGKVYTADTWEVVDGAVHNITANFRAYDSPAESMADYYELTVNASRYAKAVSYGSDQSKWLTPKETVTALWQAGYATDSLYVQKVMNTLNGRNLDQWDKKIDGVTTDIPIAENFGPYTVGDIVSGKLVTADSGRTIVNATSPNSIAIDWEKAPTVKIGNTYTVMLDGKPYVGQYIGSTLYIAILSGDSATITPSTNSRFTVKKGDKIGFYMDFAMDIDPSMFNGSKFVLQADNDYSDINTGEIQKSAIAYFVKIE